MSHHPPPLARPLRFVETKAARPVFTSNVDQTVMTMVDADKGFEPPNAEVLALLAKYESPSSFPLSRASALTRSGTTLTMFDVDGKPYSVDAKDGVDAYVILFGQAQMGCSKTGSWNSLDGEAVWDRRVMRVEAEKQKGYCVFNMYARETNPTKLLFTCKTSDPTGKSYAGLKRFVDTVESVAEAENE